MTNAISNSIVVSPAAASQLVIHTQPSSTATAGQPFAAQPVVYEEDPFGNLETADNSTVVSATLGSGVDPLPGATSVTLKGGVGTFTSLSSQLAETITLKFTSGSLTPATSNTIDVTSVVPPPTIPTIIGAADNGDAEEKQEREVRRQAGA